MSLAAITVDWTSFLIGAIASTVFVFIGHAKFDGLILNPGLTLKPQDIVGNSLPYLQLAVLAACSTASSRNGLLDTDSVVNAFLSGGVSNIVASHWEVDSQSTTEFMTNFYAGLKSGQTAAQSMKTARQKVWPRNRHPYYWAAFTLYGRVA